VKICWTCFDDKEDDRYQNCDACRSTYLESCRNRVRKTHDPDYAKKYYLANKEKIKAQVKVWQENNLDRVLENGKRWRKENPAKNRFQETNKRLLELRSQPPWADHKKMLKFYEQAQALTKQTGIVYSVDHIVPIRSQLVCGLHVEHNLQVIPRDDNGRKSNFSWPDMPGPLDACP
jgi:hypothetical protein